jgi:HK97 family phage major capsid protein|tara:strand:+ start:437 stop:1636 length:1200 start_codon:yes stop_codon:yes gene_type:complete
MKNIELRGQRAQLIKDADSIVASAQAEGRSMTGEEKTKFEAIEVDARGLKQEIEIIERNAEMKKEIASMEGEARAAAPKANASEAFGKYLRHGFSALNSEERSMVQKRGTASQVAGTDSLGGFLVPQAFSNELDVATAYTGAVEMLAKKLNTAGGGLLDYPTLNDTATDANLVTEAGAVTVQDMTFGNKQLSAYNYSSLVKVSQQLLQDSAFDLNSFLVEAMGERIARATNAAFTNGTGSGQPAGIVSGSALGKTAAAAGAITSDEILDLIYSIDPSYRNKPGFGLMAHDNVIAAIRALGLGSANDFPVFIPSMAVGEPDRIFGIPVHVNNDMEATIATGKKTLIAADFSKFVVRNAGGIQMLRLNERFADNLEVGFVSWKRSDSAVLDTRAVKHLIQA